MHKTCTLITTLAFALIVKGQSNQQIIPKPLQQTFTGGQFKFTTGMHVYGGKYLMDLSRYLTRSLNRKTGYSFVFRSGQMKAKGNDILLKIDPRIKDDEGYSLLVKRYNITITAKSKGGIFYGIQSLLQLLPVDSAKTIAKHSAIKIPCTTITDAPRFAWRGMMLDLSRHFIDFHEIEKLIDAMAAQKMNRLHLHLTDNPGWRIEIKEYPELTAIGAIGNRSDSLASAQYLTEKQGSELAAYAAKRFITIVPEIDMPGHSAAVARAYPTMSGGETTLNIGNAGIDKFTNTIINRVTNIFNTKYFHFGGDEVFKTGWLNVPDTKAKMTALGFTDAHQLEGWFDRNMAKRILNKKLQPVAWDEAAAFGVDKRTIVQWWRGIQPESLSKSLQAGNQVIISPVNYVYFDYGYNKNELGAPWEGLINGGNSTELVYHWEPIPATLPANMRHQVLGIEACVWTEFISSNKRLEYMIFPRLSAFAEVAWAPEANKNWSDFKARLDLQLKRYQQQGINFRVPDLPDADRPTKQPEGFKAN